MPPDTAEFYFADCGDLRLDVRKLPKRCAPVFEFRVIDKRDASICWVGTCMNLEDAQASALLEARKFADVPADFTPQWTRGLP